MKKLVYNPELDAWFVRGQSLIAKAPTPRGPENSLNHDLKIFSIGEYGCAVVRCDNGIGLFTSDGLNSLMGNGIDDFSLDILKSSIHKSDLPKWKEHYEKFEIFIHDLPEEQKRNYKALSDYTFRHKQKGLRRIYQQITPLGFENGKIISYLFIFTDITYLKAFGKSELKFVEIKAQHQYKYLNKQLRKKENHPFSVRQLEILKCMGENMNSSEIAAYLKISRNTVHNHKKNLLQKSGEKSSLNLLIKARHFGWV